MGDFRIVVNAVGGHGDKRTLKDGEKNYGCLSMTCPDCLAREFVATLTRRGATIKSATLEHWPGQGDKSCTYAGTRQRWDGATSVIEPVGEHAPECGTGGRPIVDDLVNGVRTGSFGNTA